jgi:hypothetical protein
MDGDQLTEMNGCAEVNRTDSTIVVAEETTLIAEVTDVVTAEAEETIKGSPR